MAATSLLARLGLRLATLGSAASLAIAAPIAEGDVSQTAHTHAARTGVYFPTVTSIGLVANAVEQMRVDATGVTMGLTGSYAKWDESSKYFDIYTTVNSAALYAAVNRAGGNVALGANISGFLSSGGAAIQSAGALFSGGAVLDTNGASIGAVLGLRSTATAQFFIGGGGGAGTINQVHGVEITVQWGVPSASTLTTNRVYGIQIDLQPGMAGGSTNTTTDVYGFRLDMNGSGITANITNFYGMYLATPTAGVLPTITNRWGVYQQDPLAANIMGGGLQIGGTAVAQASGLLVISRASGSGTRFVIQNNDLGRIMSVDDDTAVAAKWGLAGASLNLGPISMRSDGGNAGFNFSSVVGGASVIFNQGAVAGPFSFFTTPTVIGTLVERMRLFGDGGVQIGGAFAASPGAGCLTLPDDIGNVTRLNVRGRSQFVSSTNTAEIAFFGHPGFQGLRIAGVSEGVLLESANDVATAANAGATFINFYCNGTTSQMAMDIGRGISRSSNLSRTAGGWALNAFTAIGRDAGTTITNQTLLRVANRNPTATLALTGGASYFAIADYDTTLAAQTNIFWVDSTRALNLLGPIYNGLGTVALPSYSFTGDQNTGIYSAAADRVNMAVNGVKGFTLSASDVALGYNSSTGFAGGGLGEVAIGLGATTNGVGSIAIGGNANTGATFVASICLGPVTTCTGARAFAIGRGATAAANEVVFGNAAAGNDAYYTQFYMGTGKATANPASVTLNAGGGSGTDIAGGNLLLASGKGTGAGAPGYLSFWTPNVLGTGTTLQTITEKMRIYADGGVAIGGSYSGSSGAGSLRVNGLTVAADRLYVYGANTTVLDSIFTWSGGAAATELPSIHASSSIQALTGNQTGAVGLAAIRTEHNTNSALTSAVTVTGMAGWYEKGNLGFALGGGGALTITNYYGGYVANLPALAAGVTITNQYGLYIEAPTRGGTLNRSLHAVGAGYFGGSLTLDGLGIFNAGLAVIRSSATQSALTSQLLWGSSPGASEVSVTQSTGTISALTGSSTGTPVGLAAVRTKIETNAALVTARTIAGFAGWYEKGDLGIALGGGGALSITNYYGGYVANLPALAAGVGISNQYGLYLEAPTRGSVLNASLYSAGLVVLAAAEDHAITQVAVDTALDATHFTVLVDASGGPVVITLPDSTATLGINGRVYNVKKIDATGNTVTVTRAGASDLIDGATTSVITVQYQSRGYQCRTASAAANRWNII